MTETARTLTFVGVAAASLAVAWVATPPVDITPDQLKNAKLGQEFFPDFLTPTEATSIRVVSFDEAKAEPRIFAVEFKDGLWTIPSHHNYPADGATRLAKTAATAIGIKRDEFRSASKDDQPELGVVDPLDSDASRLKGRGQRITLMKGESPLVDLIIGKPVSNRPGFYFVRRVGEDSTYVAKIDIDLSTKFADWVETDLLKVNRDALKEIEIDNYSISTDGGKAAVVPGEVTKLDRDKPADPWKLEGLNEATEEVDTTKVNDLVGTLDDLKLVGVRPKPKGLNADLTIDREFVQNQLELQVLLGDMRARGFEVGPSRDDSNQPRLYSRQGEMNVATNEGVVYTLRFGEIFSGDESEIETGIEADKKKADAAKEAENKEGEKKDEKESTSKQSSRYLFVSTSFNEALLGDKPVEPERPAGLPEEPKEEEKDKPKKGSRKTKAAPRIRSGKKGAASKAKAADEETEKSDADEEKADDAKAKSDECGPPSIADDDAQGEAKAEDAPADEAKKEGAAADEPDAEKKDEAATEKSADDKPADQAGDAEKPAEQEKKEEKSPEQIKKDYETLKAKYEADLKAYEAKVKAGEEKVEDLNRRFGEWYYVISADSFNKLHLSRKELVKAKGAEADSKAKEGVQPTTKEAAPANDTEKSDAPSSDEKEGASEEKAPEEKAAEEKAAEEKAAEEKPAEQPNDAGEKPPAKTEKDEKP